MRIPLDPSEALQDLSKYDFSRVRVKLVMSVPGKYTGFDQMNEYGLCRLGNLLKEEKWVPPAGQRVEGEYQVRWIACVLDLVVDGCRDHHLAITHLSGSIPSIALLVAGKLEILLVDPKPKNGHR
jgi:hypothetical protein